MSRWKGSNTDSMAEVKSDFRSPPGDQLVITTATHRSYGATREICFCSRQRSSGCRPRKSKIRTSAFRASFHRPPSRGKYDRDSDGILSSSLTLRNLFRGNKIESGISSETSHRILPTIAAGTINKSSRSCPRATSTAASYDQSVICQISSQRRWKGTGFTATSGGASAALII
jgi:hypothetical protein